MGNMLVGKAKISGQGVIRASDRTIRSLQDF